MADKKTKPETADSNRDPLSGEPGAHPVGTGVGAAVGGGAAGAALGTAGAAMAAGTAVGAAAGPVGAVVGAVAGGVAGGLVGKRVAESINPTAEDAYWREHYHARPYAEKGTSYDEYRPAYQYGWESRGRHEGKRFEEVESDLRSGWDKARAKSRLTWDKAKQAVRDAWDRVDRSAAEGTRVPVHGEGVPAEKRPVGSEEVDMHREGDVNVRGGPATRGTGQQR